MASLNSSGLWVCSSCKMRSMLRIKTYGQKRAFSKTIHRTQAHRPPTAPQPTPNVAHLRLHKQAYEENCINRRYFKRAEDARNIDSIFGKAHEVRQQVQEPRHRLRALQKRIGMLQAKDGDTKQPGIGKLKKEAQTLKEESEIDAKEAELAAIEQRIQDIALSQPSLTSPETPLGEVPKLIEYLNYDPSSSESMQLRTGKKPSHAEIGTDLSLLDFSAAGTTTGWGWYYLKSQAALLEQALIQYSLSVLVKRGWTIISPPSIVYSHIAEACGFQPRDLNNEQQIYELAPSNPKRSGELPSHALAGTSEIPLAAMLASQTINSNTLPLKVAGVSRCYRAEAGARGVSSKGLYRVHEFSKVEMFAWADAPNTNLKDKNSIDPITNPQKWTSYSQPVFDEMVSIQKEILTSLGLPCRVLEMPISDLGASAYRKIDIECFFPSRYKPQSSRSSPEETKEEEQDPQIVNTSSSAGWGELTSTSLCTDYQTRRLATRAKDSSPGTIGKNNKISATTTTTTTTTTRFPHTVNGTAMAVPRVLAALIEYGYREGGIENEGKGENGKGKGWIEIPDVLKEYMPGAR